ncbi:acyltransferase [bacterium]
MQLNNFKYFLSFILGKFYCFIKGVEFGPRLKIYGLPLIKKNKKAKIVLGEAVVLTSNFKVNLAGIKHKIILAAPNKESEIIIGNNSGLSGCVIYADKSVRIGNYVNIGANTSIYDTDFHSIDYLQRRENKKAKAVPVTIEDDVWIGSNAVILKGVTIARGAVIGSNSVVTKDVPEFTVWAGNPAKYIKDINRE